MTVSVYIKGQQIDIYQGVNYSMTKQVNEFTELTTRQWDYSNKIRAPKTAHNRKVMEFLGFAGNNSMTAYERITGAQMLFNGVPIVMDGYAMVQETTSDYNLVIYDGSVAFFEAIKNLTLRNLDYSSLNHSYGANTMESAFGNTSGYIYPVAITVEGQPLTHKYFDLPSPSLFVKDLVQLIAAISGWTITGSLLSDSLYQKAVITTEKGVKLSRENDTLEDSSNQIRTIGASTSYTEATPPELNLTDDFYRVVLDYEVYGDTDPAVTLQVDGSPVDAVILNQDSGSSTWYLYGSDFVAEWTAANPNGIQTTVDLTLTAHKINFGTTQVVFSSLVHNVSLTDFLKQILTLWCVNPYADIKNKILNLDFINDYETAEIVPLSKYLQGGNREEYQLGGYASNNEFRYALEEDQDDNSKGELRYSHNEGEVKTHFTSRFSQPVLNGSIVRNWLWDEDLEPKDGKIKILYVESQAGTTQITTYGGLVGKPVTGWASYVFEDLKFSKLIPKYYNFLQDRVFSAPAKIVRSLAFPVARFYALDLRKLYYLKQEGSDFIVNKAKLNSQGLTEMELIRVGVRRDTGVLPVAAITGQTQWDEFGDQTVQLTGEDSYSPGGYITAYAWEIKDESDVVQYTSDKVDMEFLLPEGETWTACLTVTNQEALTHQRCESVISNPPTGPSLDIFDELELILSDYCYTLMQFKITHDPNTTFTLRVRGSIANGEGKAIIWNANASDGVNCQTSGCPVLGQIDLPQYGPGVNEVHYFQDIDMDVDLDSNGEALIQIRANGSKDPQAPQPNYFGITAYHDASGYSKNIILRQWSNPNLC